MEEGQLTDNTMYSLHLREKVRYLKSLSVGCLYHLGLACENLPRA